MKTSIRNREKRRRREEHNKRHIRKAARLAVERAKERALKTLWKKGAKAWQDVKSATEWVESHRGNQVNEKQHLDMCCVEERQL